MRFYTREKKKLIQLLEMWDIGLKQYIEATIDIAERQIRIEITLGE